MTLARACGFALLAALGGALAEASPFLDRSYTPPPEFRGLWWETKLPSRSDMVLIGRDRETSYHKRSGEKMELGQVPLREVTYGFYRDRFFSVRITAQATRDYFVRIVQTITAAYGDPYYIGEEGAVVAWGAVSATNPVNIRLTEDRSAGILTLAYSYEPIVQERERERTLKAFDARREVWGTR